MKNFAGLAKFFTPKFLAWLKVTKTTLYFLSLRFRILSQQLFTRSLIKNIAWAIQKRLKVVFAKKLTFQRASLFSNNAST